MGGGSYDEAQESEAAEELEEIGPGQAGRGSNAEETLVAALPGGRCDRGMLRFDTDHGHWLTGKHGIMNQTDVHITVPVFR